MTKQEYFDFQKEFFEKGMEITKAKNADYTGGNPDPFANFKRTQWVEIGFLTRMGDKFSRIESFIANGRLEITNESAVDSLLDLANYCSLMAGYLKSIEQPKKAE